MPRTAPLKKANNTDDGPQKPRTRRPTRRRRIRGVSGPLTMVLMVPVHQSGGVLIKPLIFFLKMAILSQINSFLRRPLGDFRLKLYNTSA